MFLPPQQSGSYDSEAEVARRKEMMRANSVWVDIWFLLVGTVKLPVRLWRKARGRKR